MGVGGNTPCVELRVADELIVFDAGTGIIGLGKALMAQDQIRTVHIVLSHYHWDHIAGLPFFDPAFDAEWTVHFYAPAQNAAELENYLAQQMTAPFFPVDAEEWLAKIHYHAPQTSRFTPATTELCPITLHHPGTTYGYRFSFAGKNIVYAPDNELGLLNTSMAVTRPTLASQDQSMFDAMTAEEHRKSIAFMRDVDLLIHDAQYTVEDYDKKQRWGHSCFEHTVSCALEAGVRDLFFFSHDPSYDDEKVESLRAAGQRMAEERQSPLLCWTSTEGRAIDLDYYAATGRIAPEYDKNPGVASLRASAPRAR